MCNYSRPWTDEAVGAEFCAMSDYFWQALGDYRARRISLRRARGIAAKALDNMVARERINRWDGMNGTWGREQMALTLERLGDELGLAPILRNDICRFYLLIDAAPPLPVDPNKYSPRYMREEVWPTFGALTAPRA